ncbi:MAG: hypothetical protein AAB916_02470 [Patescibacteria group bacterium]
MPEKITTIEALAAMIQRTMASKEDLERFATKGDMETLRAEMATREDLHVLEQKMDDGFRGVHRRIDLLHEDISDLPDIREAVSDLGGRMERVEQKVGLTR